MSDVVRYRTHDHCPTTMSASTRQNVHPFNGSNDASLRKKNSRGGQKYNIMMRNGQPSTTSARHSDVKCVIHGEV